MNRYEIELWDGYKQVVAESVESLKNEYKNCETLIAIRNIDDPDDKYVS